MKTLLKNKRVYKVIAIILVMAVSVTCFGLTVFAEAFYQGGDVVTSGIYTGGQFSSGNSTHLTVSARAQVKAGSPRTMSITLQKYGIFGWTNVRTDSLTVNDNTYTLYRDLVISRNTSYRILCSITSGSGADVATIHLGIGMW